MDDNEAFEKVKQCILNTVEAKDVEITPKSRLINDIGADSLDLIDLFFRLEQSFKIKLSPREIEKQIKSRLNEKDFEKDGFITDEAIEELKTALPEIDPSNFKKGLRQADLPALITVEVIVNLVLRKVREYDAKG